MRKKKEKSLHPNWRFIGRLIARVWIVTMPVAIALVLLVFYQKMTPLWAGLVFLGFTIFAATVVNAVFNELENFITYLKKLAQGVEVDPPRFQKGIFSSSRLADTFQSVKKRWFEQTLSDASILEHLPTPLLMIDAEGVIVFMNQKASGCFGEKMLHRNSSDLFSDEVSKRAVRAVLSKRQVTEWFEWNYQDWTFHVRIDRLPVETRDRAIVVVTMNDITPFKRFREQQAEFFANASHELKTPLSIISGFIETLQGPAKDDAEARQKFLSMMGEQTTRMTGLVQDLLRLSKQQTVRESGRQDVVVLSDLIRGVMADLKNKATTHKKQLILKTECDVPRLIANRMELQHVFQNLIDNAIKYGAANSDITVTLGLRDGFPGQPEDKRQVLAVAVHNTGEAIAPKHLDKLFNRFYRVDSVQAKKVGGTGLGLSIVQQIVQEHNGMIDVVSTDKAGTTFTVYLPMDL